MILERRHHELEPKPGLWTLDWIRDWTRSKSAQAKGSLGTRPSENRKEGLGDRLGSKCTEWNVWNL